MDDLSYRGVDRRAPGVAFDAVMGRPWLVAGAALFLVWLLVVRVAVDTVTDGAANVLVSHVVLVAIVLAGLLAGLCLVLYRLAGDARAAHLSMAAALLAGLGVVDLIGQAPGSFSASELGGVRAALLLAALGAVALATTGPDVDTGLRPLTRLAAISASGVAAWLVLELLGLGGLWSPMSLGGIVVHVGTGIGALGLSILTLRRAMARRHALCAWAAWLTLALGLMEFARALWQVHAASWLFASVVVGATGLLSAVTGAIMALRHLYLRQSGQLYMTEVEQRTHAERLHAQQAERSHEARNALLAIEGATLTLERHRDALRRDDRDALLAAVAAEIQRLQHLVADADDAKATRDEVAVWRVVERQVALARSRGVDVTAVGDPAVVALGGESVIAEALQNVLINVERHAGTRAGEAARVHVQPRGRHVLIRVEDRGPGVTRELREAIFERGRRGTDASVDGQGLGLFVSRRLLREHGGDIWVEGRPGGGASFVLCLAAAEPGAPHSLSLTSGEPG